MLDIKEILKNNGILRRFVKKTKIFMAFMADAKDYSKFYLESAEKKGHYSYRIMLLIHSLEKGMCMETLRPFGQKKAYDLMSLLKKQEMTSSLGFEYELGISVLNSWIEFYDTNHWEKNEIEKEVEKYIQDKNVHLVAGRKEYNSPKDQLEMGDFTGVMLSRRSVRDFKDKNIEYDDLMYALKMFVETPTACNRQMCRVYQVKNPQIVEILNKTILGVGGFNRQTMHYFVVTYDIAAFDFYGERNQGYLNAGLSAMNFANGLHARGIGSCFMQWANKSSEDKMVRNALGLKDSERIAVTLGAGYYKETTFIPCSCRRDLKDIYSEVE